MTTEINLLKRQARNLYIQIRNQSANADCGVTLLNHISPNIANKQIKLDKILKLLKELDPGFPK